MPNYKLMYLSALHDSLESLASQIEDEIIEADTGISNPVKEARVCCNASIINCITQLKGLQHDVLNASANRFKEMYKVTD